MNALARCLLSLAALSFLAPAVVCQDFGPQQVITTLADGALSVYATDLDGDGDADVLSASRFDNKIAWYENLGSFATSYCTSNPNSTGSAASIFAEGSASVAANDLVLHSSPVPNQPGIFFYGLNQVQIPFGNGFLCASGSIKRLPPTVAVGNLATYALDFPSLSYPINPGDTWNFQHWFRDPAAGAAHFNTSNGLEITFTL